MLSFTVVGAVIVDIQPPATNPYRGRAVLELVALYQAAIDDVRDTGDLDHAQIKAVLDWRCPGLASWLAEQHTFERLVALPNHPALTELNTHWLRYVRGELAMALQRLLGDPDGCPAGAMANAPRPSSFLVNENQG